MNLIYVLALVGLALVGRVAAGPEGLAEELCRSEGQVTSALTKLSDVKTVIELLESDQSIQCPEGVKAAILALKPVIELDSVCSEKAADVIVDFWSKYMQKKSKLSNNLPKPLRNFFIGFGLQASKLCKTTMMNDLEKVGKEMGITEQDVHVVTRAIKESKKVQKVFGKKPSLEDLVIIIPTDAAKDENGAAKVQKRKVNMPPKHKKYFKLMQERCVNKFKPIYDTLISPIVRLASIGMNYEFEDPLAYDSFQQGPIYTDWFNIIAACEPIVRLEAVLIPANKLTADGNAALVTVLEEDDLAELREKTGLTLEEPEINEPIDYKVDVATSDLIIDEGDKHLSESIENYGKKLKQTNKMRFVLLKRFAPMLKSMFMSKTVQFGLKPVETGKRGHLTKFGMSGRSKTQLGVFAIGITLLAIVGGSMAAGIVFAAPLTPLWISIGALLTFVILMGMTMLITTVPE